MQLIEQVSHDHKIDLLKLGREWDIRRGIELEEQAGLAFGPFHQRFVLDRAPEKVQKILGEMKRAKERGLDGLVCSKQGFASADYSDFPGANLRAAIASTTTETNLWDPGIFCPLPVGEIRVGRAWEVKFGGVHGTTGTPTIQFQTRIGTNNSAPPTGPALGAGPTMTMGTVTAPQPFYGQGLYGCRALGVAASGTTMTGNGFVIMAGATAATTVATPVFGGITIPTNIDSTVAQAIGVSMIWSANSASNTLTPQFVVYQSLN